MVAVAVADSAAEAGDVEVAEVCLLLAMCARKNTNSSQVAAVVVVAVVIVVPTTCPSAADAGKLT